MKKNLITLYGKGFAFLGLIALAGFLWLPVRPSRPRIRAYDPHDVIALSAGETKYTPPFDEGPRELLQLPLSLNSGPVGDSTIPHTPLGELILEDNRNRRYTFLIARAISGDDNQRAALMALHEDRFYTLEGLTPQRWLSLSQPSGLAGLLEETAFEDIFFYRITNSREGVQAQQYRYALELEEEWSLSLEGVFGPEEPQLKDQEIRLLLLNWIGLTGLPTADRPGPGEALFFLEVRTLKGESYAYRVYDHTQREGDYYLLYDEARDRGYSVERSALQGVTPPLSRLLS